MKVIRTAAVGSLVALAGAATLCVYGPLVPQALLWRPHQTVIDVSQFRASPSLSALGVLAFVAGLLTAVGGIASASRYGGVSARCRKLILLAGTAVMVAAGPMLLTTVSFFLYVRDLLRSPDPWLFVRLRDPPGVALLYVAFVLLAAAAVSLFAASLCGVGQQPPKRLNRLAAAGVALVTVAGLVFWDALRESYVFAATSMNIIAVSGSRPRDVFVPLYRISLAQVVAGACLLALGATIAAFAVLVRPVGPKGTGANTGEDM
jgi:hypothetical protein